MNSGPDTDSKKELIPSTDATAPPAPSPSEWTMRLYSSSTPLSTTPDVSTLQLIGQRTIRAIDFRDVEDFRKVRIKDLTIMYMLFCLISCLAVCTINA